MSDILKMRRWAKEKITHGFRPATLAAIRKTLGEWCYVAEANKRVIGFVAGGVRVSKGLAVVSKGARYLEVADLYVPPGWRSKGIGRQLVDALLAQGKRRRIRYAMLYSSTKDAHRVMRFYERAGFENWYVQMYRRL